jgi:DNA-binding transcriptional LysR family regulator
MLHGLRSYAYTWDPVARPLSDSYHLFAPDFRGRGDSDWDPQQDYYTDRYVEDVESLGLVVQAGMGVAILPRKFASQLDGVEEVRPEQVGADDLGPIASRDVWMVVHSSKQRLPNVRAVMGWLERALGDAA